MSSLAVNAITDASGGNTASINGATPTTDNTMGRNRIINGAMEIDQRNAGASVTLTSGRPYIVDRFWGLEDSSGTMTAQQSSVAPAGFSNSLLFTTTASATVSATQGVFLGQSIEGFNVADLGWGSANAAAVTLSFWVRSSLTGAFGGALTNSAETRSYPFSYTINAANTWEQKTITVAGDTFGTWLTTNGVGVKVIWGLGVGSTYSGTAGAWAGSAYYSATGATSVIATNGATFYITGVQLEAGSVSTSFERRMYPQELHLCQRYFCSSFPSTTAPTNNNVQGEYQIHLIASGDPQIVVQFPVEMRVTPTVTLYNPNRASPAGQWDKGATAAGSNARAFSARSNHVMIDNTDVSLATGGWGICWSASAEL